VKTRLDTGAWIAALKLASYDTLLAYNTYDDIYHDSDTVKAMSADDIAFIKQHDGLFNIEDCSDYYPQKWTESLGEKRPRLLFSYGNAELLSQPSIFICGSRKASLMAQKFARKCGRIIGMESSSLTVVSGFAKGIDSAAHAGALDAGGSTAAILPQGLSRFSAKRIGGIDDPDNFLVVTEQPPLSRFSRHSALRRNKLMVAMSSAVIVIEPSDTGGTWYSAECARRMGKPLYFFEGERTDFTEKLINMGGIRIEMLNQAPQLGPVLKHCRAS